MQGFPNIGFQTSLSPHHSNLIIHNLILLMLIIVFDDCDDHKFKSFVGIADMQFCRLEKLCPPDGSKVGRGVKVKTRKIKCQLRDFSTTRLLNVWNKAIKRCDWSWPTRWLRSTSTPVSSPAPTLHAMSSSYSTHQSLVRKQQSSGSRSYFFLFQDFLCILTPWRFLLLWMVCHSYLWISLKKTVDDWNPTSDDNLLIVFSVSGECEMDYVQFGRDILFITSHRSNK